jgi:hypothetical protein
MIALLLCLGLTAEPAVPAAAHAAVARDTNRYVNFTLYNSLLRPIPLVIPGVMNPNLLPRSRSGVTLEVGQQIFYVRNRKRELFYTVPEDLVPGTVVDCGLLLERLDGRP